jgi:hypothetical protein
MVPGESAGGTNLLPQSVCAVFLVGKILFSGDTLPRALKIAFDPAELGLLVLFLAYAVLTAFVMPRLFAHLVVVFPMAVVTTYPVPLEPSAANVTQSAYLTLSVGIALAFALAGQRSDFRRHFLQAMLFGGAILIATGVLDLVAMQLGLNALLDPFRNATYALLVEVAVEVLGSKRVVGLMPEASAYGPSCVATAASLAFLRPCFASIFRAWMLPATILGLLTMAVLSTSSTAYLGLGIFGVVFAANWLRRWMAPDAPYKSGLFWEAMFIGIAGMVVLGFIAFAPSVLDSFYAVIDQVIFRKVDSDSFVGRTSWSATGMDAFFATWGLGVGLGSARTSNWFVAILSNTGIIGTVLLSWFVLRLYLRRCRNPSPFEREFATALKFSLVPWFFMVAFAGTNPDFGVAPGMVFGLIIAIQSDSAMCTAVDNRSRSNDEPMVGARDTFVA